MRPAIKAGLRMVWRDRDTLQIGIDPRRAVALTGMRGAAALIGLLDGSREHQQVLTAAQDQGISRAAADRIIGLLAAAGVLADFPAGALRSMPDGTRTRLAGELATVSLAHGVADGGTGVLARRQAAAVRVYGAGPVGPGVASLLTASGVGHVVCTGPVGPPAAQRGRPAPPPVGWGRRPDLAVLTGRYPPELPAALMAGQIVHLAASAGEAIGVVGPLVVPGETACLNCVDLARSDRDPAWPLILAQLTGPDALPAACGAVLAATVAAQAAGQALAFLDRARPADAVRDGTLELVLPGWQWRRRSWRRHDECRCSRWSSTCPRM